MYLLLVVVEVVVVVVVTDKLAKHTALPIFCVTFYLKEKRELRMLSVTLQGQVEVTHGLDRAHRSPVALPCVMQFAVVVISFLLFSWLSFTWRQIY